MIMVRDRNFYTRVFLLAASLALQNVITFSVNLADNIMVGQLGELALSGAYVGNQLHAILHMLVLGLSGSLMILGAQYWGTGKRESVKTIVGIALKLGLGAGSVLLFITLVDPTGVLRLFTDEPAVIAEAEKYLVVIRFSYIFFCVTQILVASMRCVETVRIGMYLSIMTFVINVSLNWILIFGNLGAPALGLQGAAIATLVARIVETVVVTVYVRFVDKKLLLRFRELIRTDITLLKRYFRYGFPVILGDIFWGINLAVQGAIMGRLGATALASVSIANVVFSILSVAVFGTTGATAIIIGQTVGSGDYDRVREYARTLQVLFLAVGLLSGLIVFGSTFVVGYVYDLEPETLAMTQRFLRVLSIMIVGTSYQVSCLVGIVRAGGATHFVLVNDLIFIWGFVIPSALVAAFVFHASPVIVFAFLKSDQILKCAVAVYTVNRFRWMKNLTLDKTTTKNPHPSRMGFFRRSEKIKDSDWDATVTRHAILDRLTDEEVNRLRALAEQFLRKKQIRVHDGVPVDDTVRPTIAALACLPVLNLDLSWYSGWATVLVVPEDYETDVTEVDDAGVVHEGTDFAAGEYAPLGLIILSLPDVLESGRETGFNVVIHEAAHVIDACNGSLDGAPPLHRGMDAARWTATFTSAYSDLQRRVGPAARRRGRRRGVPSVFDPYAAEAPEEFFAVASELFFERPERLRKEYPDVYDELSLFYRQDPTARHNSPPGTTKQSRPTRGGEASR
ncbi:MAG: MATE family efflux transporter [Spirochaetaceae bacterium]|nr:MAG: MATE family efflux transporter [Spirochaetaceae bacterium]